MYQEDVSVTGWYRGDVVAQITGTTDHQARLYMYLPTGLKDKVTVESDGLLFFVEGSCWSEPPIPEPTPLPTPTPTPSAPQYFIRLPIMIGGS